MFFPEASAGWSRRLGILSRSSDILSFNLVRYRFSIALWVLRRGLVRPSGALAARRGGASFCSDLGEGATRSLLNAGDRLCIDKDGALWSFVEDVLSGCGAELWEPLLLNCPVVGVGIPSVIPVLDAGLYGLGGNASEPPKPRRLFEYGNGLKAASPQRWSGLGAQSAIDP